MSAESAGSAPGIKIAPLSSSGSTPGILSSSESAADTFAAIDNSFTLGDTLGDANGFYVFIYDYNDTCVLHVASPRFVGMDLGSVFRNVSMRANGTDLHLLFRRAAERGGGWVSAAGSPLRLLRGSKKLAQVTYPWKKVEEGMASNSEEFTKVTYIFHFNLLGRDYYGGVGFTDRDAHSPFDTGTGAATAAVEGHEYLGYSRIPDLGVDRGIPCSSQFGADPVGASTTAANCSEINSLSLLGQVLSDLFTPEVLLVFGDQTEQLQRPDFESVLSQITSRQNSVLDFDVSVFALDGDSSTYGFVAECVAYAGRPEFVGRSWQEILDMDGVKGVMCVQRESRFPLPCG